ncbi:hypothetical protein ACPH8F_002267 [Escherichia coli]
MITSPPKRGMALVVVLVLLAVIMLVTITLSGINIPYRCSQRHAK